MAKWRANTWHRRMVAVLGILFLPVVATTAAAEVTRQVYSVPAGSHPHDVAPDPAPGGPVWSTAQHQGALGRLDPPTGKTLHIPPGAGPAPHGVIVGPDAAPRNPARRPTPTLHAAPPTPHRRCAASGQGVSVLVEHG